MNKEFSAILRALITDPSEDPIAGIRVTDQFRRGRTGPESAWRDLNVAFLMALAKDPSAGADEFDRLTRGLEKDPALEDAVAFYRAGVEVVPSEIAERVKVSRRFAENLHQLFRWVQGDRGSSRSEAVNRVWRVFFPEGVSLFQGGENTVRSLRRKRRVRITRLNPNPIQDPARQILFTSNVLLTIPRKDTAPNNLRLSAVLQKSLPEICREPQRYWYDHPIPLGVEPEHNEVIHGLVGLDRAVSFEKERGNARKDAKVTCVLSVSCTHSGLQKVSKAYLEETLGGKTGICHLDVYAMAETDVDRLLEEVLIPAGTHCMGADVAESLREILGVDGEYGRHYSFLKAIAAFWHVFIDPGVKATFKIDLDQIFPQEELARETGSSAFEHFRTPLWGAEGVDWQDHEVHLGMIAGALVNEGDIRRSIFTPDLPVPDRRIHGDEWIFFSRLPQALSTQAEMMTQYRDRDLDGRNRCIQRVHVTGGTTGILVDSLRKYRPFTPSFIGRAEDQAYLLSVLFRGHKPLRYVHKDGLFMRHDKETFAGEAIEAGAVGKLVGDLARVLLFSNYANALPWSMTQTKELMDPYTGCFITSIPATIVYLRMAFKAAALFQEGRENSARELLELGTRRLWELIRTHGEDPERLKGTYAREKKAWDDYYNVLESLETALASRDPLAVRLRDRAQKLMADCKIRLKGC